MDIVYSVIGTSSLLTIIAFLAKNLIITRLTNSVRLIYDSELEKLKAELRKSEEILKGEIRARDSVIEAIRSSALSNVSARQTLVFQREMQAIESVWNAVISLAPAKAMSAILLTIKYDAAIARAERDSEFRKIFELINKTEVSELTKHEANKNRPFLSKMAWAYFSAYEAIAMHSFLRMHMLKTGLNIEGVVDTEKVAQLLKVALPHQTEYLEKYGVLGFHYLLEELEQKMLLEFSFMLSGEKADSTSLERAAAITKHAEILSQA